MPRSLPHVAAGYPVSPQRGGAVLGMSHRLVIAGRPEQVSAARAFIRQVLGSDHPGVERAILLTSELVTNSVRHSDSRHEGGTVTITVTAAPERIRVEVIDDGGPTVPAVRPGDDLTENGRGLRLVEAYALTWNYRRSAAGTHTWFECLPEPLA
ncbi:MAG: ATP-binding protein [Streptosporangiaceae bacterium]